MDTQQALLAAIHADPGDHTAWLALADWLEETGRTDQAELLRMQRRLGEAPQGRARVGWQRRVQELLESGVRPLAPTLCLPLNRKGTVVLEAALIPPGRFQMGARPRERHRETDERPQRWVTLSRPFYLALYPVTQAQWRAVMRRNRSHFRGDDQRPADSVGWDDARQFCEAAGQSAGRTIRLPTEAEWEYACRAGTTTEYSSGNGEGAMRRVGWCDLEMTQPVGQLQPNGWGLHDMHGNIWEWCHDAYELYAPGDCTDPVVEGDSSQRVARGGSYSNPVGVCRSACRIGFMGGGRNEFIGFRVAVEA